MGSSISRPGAYPFPVPAPEYDVDRTRMAPKLGKWTFSSMTKKSKKGKDREKYDDFALPKFPTPTAPYAMTTYRQQPSAWQSAFPTYYAPVQMAVMQPAGYQQPMLAMPQAYMPMAAYQPAVAPVQPPVAPAPTVQFATTMHMPIPASASAPAPAMQMPVLTQASAPQPAPVPPLLSAPTQMPQSHWARMPEPQPASDPTQMPRPNAVGDPPQTQVPIMSNHGLVIPIPSSPITGEPVIPPLPGAVGSEPPRPAPDSARPRFTDFYRSPDFPPSRRASIDEPARPPTAGPAGRTPFAPALSMPNPSRTPGPMRMPTPAPASTPAAIPVSNNPLPRLPLDVWGTMPYRQVLENLPTDVSTLLDLGQRTDVHINVPADPVSRPSSRLGALFGSTGRKDKGKGPLRGLFRSRSTSGQDVLGDVADLGSASGSRHGHRRAQSVTAVVIPPPGSSMGTMDMPVPAVGPQIKFNYTGEYAGFVNHSNHRVMYKNKMYPTALHLLEAMKFMHEPRLQEDIRTCKDVQDMYPLSASYQKYVRPDWGQVFLQTMDEVLHLKFKQHPNLRTLLLGTGLANIVYADDNDYWGEGANGQGANELGKALVRVRERLRQEGER